MNRHVVENSGLIAISLLLAFFFWIVATEAENPTVERPFNPPLALELRGLPEDMVTYGLDNNRVRLELRAPESVWNTLNTDDIDVYVDLSQGMTGTVTLPVQVTVRANPVRVVSVTPSEVTLDVEFVEIKEFPISVKLTGVAALGYKIESLKAAPELAQVQGPSSYVAQVADIHAMVDIQGQQSDVRSDYELVPVDVDDNPVPNVSVGPKTVTINVAIEQLGFTRDLAVFAALDGQPAPGHRIVDIDVIPDEVRVIGRTAVVRDAPGLQTRPIYMEGITRSLTTTVPLQMPEGISVIFPPSPYVTVSLSIEAIKSGLKLDLPPVIRGLSAPFTATVGIESVVVILDGPLTIMETLVVTDVQVLLDLTNLAPGDYNLIPDVTIPEGVILQTLLPETVPVKIEEMISPTSILTATGALSSTAILPPTATLTVTEEITP